MPVLSPVKALVDSPSLKTLQQDVEQRLPEIDPSELILKINARTGFVREIIASSEGLPRAADLETSVVAVLVAEACNLNLKQVAQKGTPVLTLSRLAQVKQNYLRANGVTEANARLVEYHASLPLAQRWGGGEVASADGLRFVVPVRSIHTAPNAKYFGVQRGDPARQVRLGIKKYYLLHLDQRPAFDVARHGRSWNAQGFLVYSCYCTRATHEPQPDRDYDRHGRLQRCGVRVVPLAGVSVQSATG